MIWTPEADALLIQLWDQGGSLAYVADGMNKAGYQVSRNAVSGRRHRLTHEAFSRDTKTYATTTINPAKQRPFKQRSNNMNDQPKPIPKKPVTISAIEQIAQHDGIDYLDLPPNGCKAILDLPRGGRWQLHPVCGLPRLEGSPYCRGHYMLYTPPQTIRKAHG